MLRREIHICQRFFNAVLDLFGSLFQLHRTKLLHNVLCLFASSFFAFLSVYCFEHSSHFAHSVSGSCRENIAVKMHCAALIFGFGEHLVDQFTHTQALVANNHFHAFQTAFFQPDEKVCPAFFILFHTLGGAYYFALAVAVYADCSKNADVLKLTAPITFKVYSVNIDIRILAFKRSVMPFLDMHISLFIKVADVCLILSFYQSFRNILYLIELTPCT